MTAPKTYYAVGRIVNQVYSTSGPYSHLGVSISNGETGQVGMLPVFATREAAEADAQGKFTIYEMWEHVE